MTIRKHNLLSKILLCGASLLMIGSTGAGIASNTANAQRVHYSSVAKLYHHHKHNHKYLAYRKLIPTIKSVYHQLFKNHQNIHNKRLLHKMAVVNNTVTHNYKHYSHSQVRRLLKSYYSEALSYRAIKDLSKNLTHNHSNKLITRPTININQPSTKGTLSFNKLLPTLDSIDNDPDYNGDINDSPRLAKKMEQVNNTITQNANKYSYDQIRQLYGSKYYGYFFNHSVTNAINNQLNKYNQPQTSQAWNNRGNNDFADQVAQYDYDYINQAREQAGLNPLPINNYTQEIANLRSRQYSNDVINHDTNQIEADGFNGDTKPSDNLAHGQDYHHTNMDDAQSLGVRDDYGISENVGPINTKGNFDRGDNFGDKGHFESNHTPQEIAYNNVNDMLNYDRFTNNTHRKSILDKRATGIGVSAYYNPNANAGQATNYAPKNGGIVQDYSYSHNPDDI